MKIKTNKTPARINYCDNCGRKERVAEIILPDDSGFADYCYDCIVNNPSTKKVMK